MSVSEFLAVDLGAESGRVIVGILKDERLSLEEIYRFPNIQISRKGSLIWDVPSLFREIKKGLSLSVKKGHSNIQSIGVDTWGVDFGLIGKNNRLLELPYSYRDNRTNGIPEKVFHKISQNEIYKRTGIQFLQINTIYQLYSIKLSNEAILEECNKLLFMPDLFNFFLTGIKKSEYTIASTSQLLNAETKEFDESIFSALNLPPDIMAPIVKPGTVIGKLLPEISTETGLNDVDVVAVGSHDTASAVAAIPAGGDDWAYLSSGTWSLLGIENEKPLIDFQYKEFTNEGGVNGNIRFLRNITGLWLLQGIKKSLEKRGQRFSYEEITKMAENTDSEVPFIDTDDNRFINPPDMIDAINEFYIKTDQSIPKTWGEYSLSILQSLAGKYKTVLENIEKISNKKINKLHIVGGGSKNKLLNQLTANAAGKNIMAGPIEATALGNIVVQAIAGGKIETLEKAREIISLSFPQILYKPVMLKE